MLRNPASPSTDSRRGARDRVLFATACLAAWCVLAVGVGASFRIGYDRTNAILAGSQENFVSYRGGASRLSLAEVR